MRAPFVVYACVAVFVALPFSMVAMLVGAATGNVALATLFGMNAAALYVFLPNGVPNSVIANDPIADEDTFLP